MLHANLVLRAGLERVLLLLRYVHQSSSNAMSAERRQKCKEKSHFTRTERTPWRKLPSLMLSFFTF